MSTLRTLSLIALFFAATTLAGCGGGGSTPSDESHNTEGTKSVNFQNFTGWSGKIEVGGKSFTIHESRTLYNFSVGHTYKWRFVADGGWTTRSGSKTISKISSNIVYIH